MPYVNQNLEQLTTSVANDLRDPAYRTFSIAEVQGLVNAGIVEVSRVSPVEAIESVVFEADTAAYGVPLDDVFRVELYVDGRFHTTIPPNTSDDVGSQGGWDFFAGSIHLPWSIVSRLSVDTEDALRVWGYRARDPLVDGDDTMEGGDASIEQAVRTVAVLEGYQRLVNSRSLFQQWVQTPGNSDVSPTQLIGFAQAYEQQWQRIRQQMRKLRRR